MTGHINANGGFFNSIMVAFMDHYPLALSAEHFWLKITQGISYYVVDNAEELRSVFVDFEGQKELVCIRDGFMIGKVGNDWRGVFEEFKDKITGFIGKDN